MYAMTSLTWLAFSLRPLKLHSNQELCHTPGIQSSCDRDSASLITLKQGVIYVTESSLIVLKSIFGYFSCLFLNDFRLEQRFHIHLGRDNKANLFKLQLNASLLPAVVLSQQFGETFQ